MKETTNKYLNPVYWIAFSAIVLLTILSVIAFKERTLFVDSGWFIFNMLNAKSFYFMEMRYGAFVTQLGVVAAAHLGLSIKSILLIFSTSFYLFYLIAMWFVGVKWKQKKLGILLAFYLVLFISDGYFCTVGEIFQGLVWMFLFFALYAHTLHKSGFLHHIFLVAFAFFSLICHMIVLFPFAFLWLYLNLERTALPNLLKEKKFWIYSVILLGLGLLRYWVSTSGWYDAAKLEPVHNLSIKGFFNAFKSGHAKTFAALVMKNYWIILPIICVGGVSLIMHKKYLQLFLVVLFAWVYAALVFVVYPDGYGRNMLFYFENEWAPLSVIVSTPFVFQIFKYGFNKQLLIAGFCIIFVARLFYIFDSYQFFNHRFQNLNTITQSLHDKETHKALIVSNNEEAEDNFVMAWGVPIESMLLSKMSGHDPIVTFKIVEPNFEVHLPAKDSFYACFSVMPHQILNTKYFNIDSVQSYVPMQGLNNNFKVKGNAANYK